MADSSKWILDYFIGYTNVHCKRYKHLILCRGRKQIVRFGQGNSPKRMKTFSYENQYTRLSDIFEPLWRKSYEDQISIKKYKIGLCMEKAFNILKMRTDLKEENPIIQTIKTKYGGKICPVNDIIQSPLTKGYRNKDSFNIGPDIKGDKQTVGLYIGSYYDKTLTCVQMYFLNIMKERHKEICRALQDFIYQSSYEPWLKTEFGSTGNWKSIVIRSTIKGDVMLIFEFHPQRNPQEFVDGAKNEIVDYFVQGPGKHLGINSIYFQCSWLRKANHEVCPFELLHGSTTITEYILDLKFQISPNSFFQGNTQCAELLYLTALDLGKVGIETTVLDICCGTGTIGLIAAKRAKRVIGVEIRPQAVDDANLNAKLNGITNAEFVCEKAHHMLKELVTSDKLKDEEDVVAFLNPGRAGVNKKLIQSVRDCPKIKKVVYISCKPLGNVLRNFVDLISPSDDVDVQPFTPVVAVPVDMFPQTLHCELVVLFER